MICRQLITDIFIQAITKSQEHVFKTDPSTHTQLIFRKKNVKHIFKKSGANIKETSRDIIL